VLDDEPSCGRVVISHVTYFPPSNFSKSKNKIIIIIIANVYYKDAEPEVNINIIMKRKEYIFKYF
jgi:hypothetical protein